MWKGGDLTSRDRLNRSENYLLLGFLLVMPSQSVLLLVRQSVFQSNLSLSVSYHSFSKVKWWTNFVTIETEITLFKRAELCQEPIQSKKPLLGSPVGSIICIFVYL